MLASYSFWQEITHHSASGVLEKLTGKYHWASHTLLQPCNRSKKKSTHEPEREAPSAILPWGGPSASSVESLILTPAGKGEMFIAPSSSITKQSKAGQILELTVNKLITGTDRLSEAQMKEGRNSFSIVLYYLVRNPSAWKSRERAGALALVTRSSSFVLMSFIFVLVWQPRMWLGQCPCSANGAGQSGSMHSRGFPNKGPPCLHTSRNPAGVQLGSQLPHPKGC